MEGYTKIACGMLDSTIWTQESKETRIVWITMLLMKNRAQNVICPIPGLARRAGVTVEECKVALERLKAPDPYSNSPEEGGRRIREVPGGWFIINGVKYRGMWTREARREYNAHWMAEDRAEKRAQAEAGNPTSTATQPSGPSGPVELPPGFPKTATEARETADFVGCPKDFAEKTWDQCMARHGTDSKGRPVDWRYHLKSSWNYQKDREAREGNSGPKEIQERIQIPRL